MRKLNISVAVTIAVLLAVSGQSTLAGTIKANTEPSHHAAAAGKAGSASVKGQKLSGTAARKSGGDTPINCLILPWSCPVFPEPGKTKYKGQSQSQ